MHSCSAPSSIGLALTAVFALDGKNKLANIKFLITHFPWDSTQQNCGDSNCFFSSKPCSLFNFLVTCTVSLCGLTSFFGDVQ
uniref:Uncharacterized protein n=1 Tax=Phakopsora pachyrhizi TaxID=170000 RepID=A0A0S1MJW1_PHAPC